MPTKKEIQEIRSEWGDEFQDLDCDDAWELIEDKLVGQSRWVNWKRKVVKHEDGTAIAISYAVNTGDGDSASAYETTWEAVEPHEKTVTVWKAKEVAAC